jgi:hypothetical protein
MMLELNWVIIPRACRCAYMLYSLPVRVPFAYLCLFYCCC